jgi:hypothetical protein
MTTPDNSKNACAWCGDAPRMDGKVCCRKASCHRKYEKFIHRVKRVIAREMYEAFECPPGGVYMDENGGICLNLDAETEDWPEFRKAVATWKNNPPERWTPVQTVKITEKHREEKPALCYLVLMAQGEDVLSKENREIFERRKKLNPRYDETEFLLNCLYLPT